MKSVRVEPRGTRGYEVLVGDGLLDRSGDVSRSQGIGPGACAVVSEETVFALFGEKVLSSLGRAGLEPSELILPPGEATKSLRQLERIYDHLAHARMDRDRPLFALGGGVIGDLAGLAASTFKRGLPLVHLPTSLIAQVDSAIGGKTAVNHRSGKNLVGTFYHPLVVLCDPSALGSLPDGEYRSGLAEVVKYAVIADARLFDLLETRREAVLRRDRRLLEDVIVACCRVKAEVVSEDERDEGRRRILNFGHTVGHAAEVVAGYGALRHGEAVAAGMVAAARIAERRGMLGASVVERLRGLIAAYGLPTSFGEGVDRSELLRAIRQDKKVREGALVFVLPEAIGRVVIREDVTEEEIGGVV